MDKVYDIDELLSNPKMTSSMRQYLECKKKYEDCILLCRLGDFYEMFYDDAILGANILSITLTSKGCGTEERAPMCGIPHHQLHNYLIKFMEYGCKVAIAEQLEDAKNMKGKIIERDVVRIITPGTIIDETINFDSNNFLASVVKKDNNIGFSYVDISTGEAFASTFDISLLKEEISRVKPSELLLSDIEILDELVDVVEEYNIYVNSNDEKTYINNKILSEYFDRNYLNSLFLEEDSEIYLSLVKLFSYIFYTQKVNTSSVNVIDIYNISDSMLLDCFTRDSLELTRRMKGKEKQGSLFHILDKTNTAMGSRKLKQMIEQPSIDKEEIETRLDIVEELTKDMLLVDNLSAILRHVYDMERLCSKISFAKIIPKELVNLKRSVAELPYLKHLIDMSDCEKLKEFIKNFDDLRDVYQLIDESILDNPNTTITDGDIIIPSYNKTLEKYKNTLNNVKENISKLELEQRNKLGVNTLKIVETSNEGYYLEITKKALANIEIPNNYEKKRDLSNCVRFTFLELRQMELELIEAKEKSNSLEYQIFLSIREELLGSIGRMKLMAKLLAKLDVFLSFAKIAIENNYTKPILNENKELNIMNGRHPVVEKLNSDKFIPNDIYMDKKSHLIHIITGPNMSGKSTYMRQTALIVLMAQIGSFVPCEKANIPICDRIFTRIGSSDNLSNGQSTFMVEMSEVSQILNNATEKSLILLDEVGRGTSTYDGISLAWSIVEYIQSEIKCYTLFATHYFELIELENKFNNIKNFKIEIKEYDDRVEFLRKVIPGSSTKSYGVYIAKQAKVPELVVKRANEILNTFENNEEMKLTPIKSENLMDKVEKDEIDFFKEEFMSLDLMNMSPMEVFNEVYNLQKKYK